MITEKTHPYRVQIADKIVAFPASVSLQAVEAACQRIHDEQNPRKKRKVTPVPKSPHAIRKSASILGADIAAGGVAGRLSQILDGIDPNTAGEKEKDEIFQNLISYRKMARSLPEEQSSVLDRKIAAFNSSQVRPKFARKK